MIRMPRRAVLAVLLAAALALPAGCASAPMPAPTPDPAVRVWLHQERSDEAARRAQVRIANDSSGALDVRSVRLVDDRLGSPIEAEGWTVGPGESVDVPVTLPVVACEDGSPDRSWELSLIDGERLRGTLDDALGFLDRLRSRECLAAEVARAVRVTWGDLRVSASGDAALPLRIETIDAEADVEVVAVRSTNLLQFGHGVATYPVEGRVGTLEVPLAPQRCDPHVVQEDKRGTVFGVDVEVRGETGRIEVAAGERNRARILTWVAETCRFGEQ
ncbi:hypothetical protein ACIGEP_01990 [Microbacterium sp. NPDC077663]|uniref:hypothetical protein n=1 Tax=Microbacterium sp. NPDC077663 TaxID=3364189 RepID=UPI0037C5E8FD